MLYLGLLFLKGALETLTWDLCDLDNLLKKVATKIQT